jgi:2-keto-3-deoxy-L-rhamnonate aldolase RhmA
VDSTRARVKAILAMGADGVVIPHVRSAAEARTAAGFFKDAGANVWTRANPKGTVVAMLMIEDAGAVAEMNDIAAVPGYSLLSCGIGSLTQALGGREKAAEAEAACQRVRDVADKTGNLLPCSHIGALKNDLHQVVAVILSEALAEEGFSQAWIVLH